MQIAQIQVSNDSIQDRLLLRVSGSEHEEIRVYITRRYLREIWPHLVTLMADHLAAPAADAPAAAKSAASEPQATFDAPYRNDNPVFPLGSLPLLPSEAHLEATGPGKARLIVREARERACTLNLTADLLQALCAMLRAASEQAGWDLALDYAQPAPAAKPAAPVASAPAKKTLLH